MNSTRKNPKFLAASHLGSLGRQLRFAGFDCCIEEESTKPNSTYPLLEEGRYFLTRSRRPFPEKLEKQTLRLQSTNLEEQMLEIALNVELRETFVPFTRCTLCNAPLKKISSDEAKNHIPDQIFHTYRDFRQCPNCRRIYWKGDHFNRMLKRWKKIFEEISKEKECQLDFSEKAR